MDEMDLSQFKEVFISEAKEHLVALNSALVELEKNPSNKDVLNKIFRVAHTLKGMSATMGYDKITSLTHSMEDILDKLRKGSAEAKGNIVDVIFECFDKLDSLIEDIETGAESKVDVDDLIKRLNNFVFAEEVNLQKDSDNDKIIHEEIKAAEIETEQQETGQEEIKASEIEIEQQEISQEEIKTAEIEKGKQENKINLQPEPSQAKKSKTSIRINISHLDTMMNLVGEMVISKSQLEQIAIEHKNEELKENLRQLDRIAVELQEAVLKTRMVPLSQIFDRFPRMVRDLSLKLSKDVSFEINGADIEIDRMLLEEINEPLIHLLRNAIDHGIETSDKRHIAGKHPKGKIILNAKRERGYISVEVSDDGKGLDIQVIKQKAVEKKVITEEALKTISDEDVFMLICSPKYSTAEKITDVSGRGVGMDVVKTAIESFNGRLEINSTKGIGSSFTINLPLSIAIISALLVKVKNEIYAIPLNNITEVVPFSEAEVKSIEKREVVMLRDEVLPLVWIERVLGVEDKDENMKNGSKNKFILRVELGNKAAGLVIDSFIGRKDIVIKALTGIVKRVKGFSGATILGDGSVVLIMDVASWI